MNLQTHIAYLLLGSNIKPDENIPRAVRLLQEHVTILRVSSVWESASADCCYPDYLDMAVMVSTPLSADDLKGLVLRPLEAYMGRVRTADKNASRQIDFDIVLFDGELMDPELWTRVYRAVPVSEMLPGLTSTDGETLLEVAQRLAKSTPIQIRPDIDIAIPERNH